MHATLTPSVAVAAKNVSCDSDGTMIDRLQTKLAPVLSPEEKFPDLASAYAASALTVVEIEKLKITRRKALIGNWFLEGDLGFWYGPRGQGKSWGVLTMALALANGLPFGPWKVHSPTRCLYVDGEMPIGGDGGTQGRCQSIDVGRCDRDDNLIVLHHEALFHLTGKVLNLTSPEAQAAVKELCVKKSIKVVFVDNISCLFSMAEDKADAWTECVLPWLLDMRRHQVAVVMVHHAGRSGHMRGTSKREDAAFWCVKLTDGKGDGSEVGAHFIASFDKNRNSTADECTPLLWHFRPQPDGSVKPEWKPMTPTQILVDLVNNGLTTCKELAEDMGFSTGYVSKLATGAERQGLIKKDGRNYVPR